MILFITGFILWLAWAVFQGQDEAAGKSNMNLIGQAMGTEKHTLWTYQRIIVGLIVVSGIFAQSIYLGCIWYYSLLHVAIISAILVLSFSFIHNGAYYIFSNMIRGEEGLDLKYTGWWHNKGANDRDGIEIGIVHRTVMFIFSLFILMITVIYFNDIIR